MNAQLMRRALALPAPLLRPLHRTAPIGAAVPPAARQLNLSHPSGWLAAAAELQTYAGPHGQVHFERNGVTAFALGTEGVDARRSATDARDASTRARHTLLFPLASGGALRSMPAVSTRSPSVKSGGLPPCLSPHGRRLCQPAPRTCAHETGSKRS